MFKKSFPFFLLTLGLMMLPLRAQFDSGSTGEDGEFSPAMSMVVECPAPDCVFNYTTVNIPAGVTVSYLPNAFNTPVTILAQGDVTITGTINVRGSNGASFPQDTLGGPGGPGGFRGGNGGAQAADGPGRLAGSGLGPGGGFANGGSGGGGSFATGGGGQFAPPYGTPSLLPIVGGSGGSGGFCFDCPLGSGRRGGGGGGGGGAVLIASSTTINFNGGTVSANGGTGGDRSPGAEGGSGGSGGAIRLIANTITGNGSLTAVGGAAGPGSANGGGLGRIRLESGTSIPGTLTSNPGPSVNIFPPFAPPSVTVPGLPSLRIATVGGQEVPFPPVGQFGPIDVTVIGTGTKTVGLAASGIPLGTTVTVFVKPEIDVTTATAVTSTGLSGAFDNSTATANVNFPAFANYFLEARATFTVPASGTGQSMKIEGEKVKQMRVETAQGAGSKVIYILESGKEVPAEKALLAKAEKNKPKATK